MAAILDFRILSEGDDHGLEQVFDTIEDSGFFVPDKQKQIMTVHPGF